MDYTKYYEARDIMGEIITKDLLGPVAEDEIICDEVESYLKFNTGRSLVQTIYNRYVNSTYYPGYWYMVGDDIIAIYDLY